MNILHTSDLHLGKMLENFSRLDEQKQFFEELYDICDNEKIDVILIAGDIYDVKNPKALAEKLFYEALKKLSNNGERLIVIIAGNHDSYERIMTLKPLVSDMGIIILGYPNTKIEVEKYETYEVLESYEGCFKIKFKNQNLNFITLPYPSEQSLNTFFDATTQVELQKCFNDHLKELINDRVKVYKNNEINLFVGHIFLRGGQTTLSEQAISVGGSLQVTTDILPKCDYIALGHLHRRQEISGETMSHYSGSPIAYSFSEYNHKKSVNVCTIDITDDEKKIDVKAVPLTTYIPLEIWKCTSKEEALEMCEKNKDSNSYVDLIIKTNEVLSKSYYTSLKALKNNIVNITTVNELEASSFENEETTFEEKSILEEFVAYYEVVHNSKPEDDLLNLFIKIGEQNDEQ